MTRLVVVSNRVAIPKRGRVPPGGLALAVLAALREHGGLWFGWSGEVSKTYHSEPHVNTQGNITFATIDLAEDEHRKYYNGYCNGILWPLCHFLPGYMRYDRSEWEAYKRVNELFARKLAPLLQPDDLIWVHDFHLIPLANELRKTGVRNRVGFFLHVPFPAYGLLRSLPFHGQLLGMLCAYDLIGVQTSDDLLAFHNCVVRDLGGAVVDDVVKVDGRRLRADVFPIGIDVKNVVAAARKSEQLPARERLLRSLNKRALIIGVDRLDYSKGLLNRFLAYERLLESYPEHHRRLVLMQIAPPSRQDVEAYEEIRRELEEAAGRINGRFSDFDWTPIRYLNQSFSHQSLMGFFRTARVGLVTPLRDGMNLVAKEYVASQNPHNPGALVLSTLAGAARELEGAVLVNPLDLDGVAEGLQVAINMPVSERRERYRAMMDILRRNDIHAWRTRFLARLQQPPT